MPPKPTLRRSLLYALIAGATATRAAVPFQHNPMDMLTSDPGRHWAHILDPLIFSPLSGIDPVGYQIWLGAVAKLTLGDRIAMATVAALLSAITPWVWYRFARELLRGKDAALLCWALIGWLPSWIGIFSYTMPETLLLPLFGGACWMIWRALRKADTASMCVALLVSLLTLLTKVSPIPVLLLGMATVVHVQPRRWRASAICVLISAAVLTGPAYRSYRILHVWAPFGYPAMNTIYCLSRRAEIKIDFSKGGYHWNYGFASPEIGVEPLAPISHWKMARQGTVQVEISMDHGGEDWWQAIRAQRPGLNGMAAIWKENAIFLLAGDSWPDNDSADLWERVQLEARWLWLLLIPAVITGDLRRIYQDRSATLLAVATLATVLMMLLQTSAVMEGRYRKPFEGLLLVNAVWLLQRERE